MRKAIICGGRDFDESLYPGIREKIVKILRDEEIQEEVCGMATGADMYGSMLAHDMGLMVADFYADWNMKRREFSLDPKIIKTNKNGQLYNSLAGINRNRRMAKYVVGEGICIALPGGSGTENMISQALLNHIPVYKYNEESGEFIKYMK